MDYIKIILLLLLVNVGLTFAITTYDVSEIHVIQHASDEFLDEDIEVNLQDHIYPKHYDVKLKITTKSYPA